MNLSLDHGVQTIRDALKNLPATPGVYRMLNSYGDVLYVGKAKALKKRVVSYTHIDKLPNRLRRMVAETTSMEFVHTHTEAEALLLESNLIKKFQPRFNILLKDDKSFPYIMISDHEFPLIKKHRGVINKKNKNQEFFGPFANAGAVYQTLQTLQKAFQIRNCTDNNFSNRTRPCLQYHIKRCTAPCVGYVSTDEYAQQIDQARQLLKGDSHALNKLLAEKMNDASQREDFEQAALYRDKIQMLSTIQSRQDINLSGIGNADAIALFQENGQSCIQVFFFRNGQNLGNKPYYPRHSSDDSTADIMANFLAQFYENKPVPAKILMNIMPNDPVLLTDALSMRRKIGKVMINQPQRGNAKRLMDFAVKNAADALKRRIAERSSEQKYLEKIAQLFDINTPIKRIEVYDNSHLSGTNMVGGICLLYTSDAADD